MKKITFNEQEIEDLISALTFFCKYYQYTDSVCTRKAMKKVRQLAEKALEEV